MTNYPNFNMKMGQTIDHFKFTEYRLNGLGCF